MEEPKIVVLIPTLNEEQAIGKVIDEIFNMIPGCEIIVIDSYSTDKTVQIAHEKRARVIYAPKGGKGLAMRWNLSDILLLYHNSYFTMIDGDFTYPAKHIIEIKKELDNGADVVIGYRYKKEKKSMSLVNKFGNRCLSLIASLLYGIQVKDICSGMWGFKCNALTQIHHRLDSDGFTFEAELFINVVRRKMVLKQIPIGYRARVKDSKAKLTVLDGFRIGWFLIKKRVVR